MARLAYVAHGLRGSLYNTLALLGRLQAAGHDVTLLSFRDVAADAAANSVDFVHLTDGPKAWEQVRAAIDDRGRLRSLPTAMRARRSVIDSNEVRRVVDGLNVDLTLVDAEMHGAIMQLHAVGYPLAMMIPWHSIFYEPGLPPMHSELTPGSDRAAIDQAWESLLAKRERSTSLGRFDPRQAPARLGPFHLNSPDPVNVAALAHRHGVDLAGLTSQREWMHPHVWTGFPTLSYTTAEFDFARQPPANFHYLGPVIDRARPEPQVSSADHERWEAFINASRAAGRRLAFCSMGSLQTGNADWYRTVIRAFAASEKWALVIGLGSQGSTLLDAEHGGEADSGRESLLILDYAPQIRCLAEADLAIHTAGTGTFYECLRCEVPSLVLQTGFVDQPGVAARIAHHGLGQTFESTNFNPTTLLAAADRVVSDDVIAGNLRSAAAVLDAYDDDKRPVRTVEAILGRIRR